MTWIIVLQRYNQDIAKKQQPKKIVKKHENNKHMPVKNKILNAMEKYQVRRYQISSARNSNQQDKRNKDWGKDTVSTAFTINPQLQTKQINQTAQWVFNIQQQLQNESKPNQKLSVLIRRANSMPVLNQQKKQPKQIDLYALSKFQHSHKTIQGRVNSKYGYNISLAKSKTNKISNVNNFYYQDKILDYSHRNKRQNSQKKLKGRNFTHNKGHDLFGKQRQSGDGGKLDKFYDLSEKKLDLIKKKISLQFDFGRLSERKEIEKKPGTQLDYDISQKDMGKANINRGLYKIQQQPRVLKISRQVINPARGCYR